MSFLFVNFGATYLLIESKALKFPRMRLKQYYPTLVYFLRTVFFFYKTLECFCTWTSNKSIVSYSNTLLHTVGLNPDMRIPSRISCFDRMCARQLFGYCVRIFFTWFCRKLAVLLIVALLPSLIWVLMWWVVDILINLKKASLPWFRSFLLTPL